ncbi:hypothetical protein I5R11_18860 [Serratia marcescens]|nr:hypothetical protein [Serratia marcescens]
MTTTITIDTTLISGVISSAVAILVACGTVIWTTVSNRRLEKTKLLQAKREEVLSLCEEMNEIISLKHFDSQGDKHITSSGTASKAMDEIRSMASIEIKTNKIKTINSIYFPEIKKDCESMTRNIVSFYSSVASMKAINSIFNSQEPHKNYDTLMIDERYKDARSSIQTYKENIISIKI